MYSCAYKSHEINSSPIGFIHQIQNQWRIIKSSWITMLGTKCVTFFFKIMIICPADERYEITKNVLSDDWVLLTIIKKQLNRSIERGPINGNCSVGYPFSYYVHQSQYSSLQMMHFNLKRYLRNPHASFVCHFHHNYCNTRLWSYCDQNSLHNITVLVWKTHRKRISQDLNSTCNYIDIVKKKYI